jgi:hypothetical protein
VTGLLNVCTVALTLSLAATQAAAWSDHRFPSYRTFERMPEVAQAASIKAEPLATFLKAEEAAIEKLLARQAAWSEANLDFYPALPAELVFRADASRSDDARKKAFLMALRMAPNAPFALYFQPDARKPRPNKKPLPHSAVNTLPVAASVAFSYFPLDAGEAIDALSVLATATEEPDNGIDIKLWEDSPSDWGKAMGLGSLPFGNPSLPYSTQAPFHMGFYHESPLIYKAADFVRHTFPLMRHHQLATLSTLAFRTGHPYWGWRFAGMSLHYLQDLTQPFHASLSPGSSAVKMIGINVLAMAGLPKWKEDMVILLSNRHLVLEYFQAGWLLRNAILQRDTSVEISLRSMERDASYPAWGDNYVRDVVSAQAAAQGASAVKSLLQAMPENYVNNPQFDYGPQADKIALNDEVDRGASAESRQRIESEISNLLGNFGAHSRNAIRGILKASVKP